MLLRPLRLLRPIRPRGRSAAAAAPAPWRRACVMPPRSIPADSRETASLLPAGVPFRFDLGLTQQGSPVLGRDRMRILAPTGTAVAVPSCIRQIEPAKLLVEHGALDRVEPQHVDDQREYDGGSVPPDVPLSLSRAGPLAQHERVVPIPHRNYRRLRAGRARYRRVGRSRPTASMDSDQAPPSRPICEVASRPSSMPRRRPVPRHRSHEGASFPPCRAPSPARTPGSAAAVLRNYEASQHRRPSSGRRDRPTFSAL